MSLLVKSVIGDLQKERVYLTRVIARYKTTQPEKDMRSLSHEEVANLERKIGFEIQEYSVDGDISVILSSNSMDRFKDTVVMCDDTPFDLDLAIFCAGKDHPLGGYGADSFSLYPEKHHQHIRNGQYRFYSLTGGKDRKKIEKVMERERIEKL